MASNNIAEVYSVVRENSHIIDAKHKFGRTPLYKAILSSNIENVKLIVEHGAEIDALDKDGNSAFHIACVHKCCYWTSETINQFWPKLLSQRHEKLIARLREAGSPSSLYHLVIKSSRNNR